MIGNEEGTGDTSTFNPTPFGPPKSRRETGTTHQPAAAAPNPYPRRRTPALSPPVTHIHAVRPQIVACQYTSHVRMLSLSTNCLLYTSDAADESRGVDLGG